MMVGIGPAEWIIIGLMFLLPVLLLVIVVAVILMMTRKRPAPPGLLGWLPKPAGESVMLHAIGIADKPVSRLAHWEGNELEVRADEPATISLFDVPLPQVQQCVLSYCFEVYAAGFASRLYPELWCRIPERGMFFSRGLDRQILGGTEWRAVELPFYLKRGQHADLVHLNLCFAGAGVVRLRNIGVKSTPLTEG